MPQSRRRASHRLLAVTFGAFTASAVATLVWCSGGSSVRPAGAAAVPASVPGPSVATVPSEPREVRFASGPNKLRGYLFEPAGAARASGIVFNHGSEPDPSLAYLGHVGRFFQSHGFAVLLPWRQGCSGSEGVYWDRRPSLPAADGTDPVALEARYIAALDQDLADVHAAIDYAASLPDVDPARLYVGGTSFGGVLALEAAATSTKLQGAIACSGAAWTFNGNTPAGQDKLDAFARAAKVPVFFLQAENDFNQGTSKHLGTVMREAGLPHAVKVYPPFGKTAMQGHAGFCNKGQGVWGEDVMAFLTTGALD